MQPIVSVRRGRHDLHLYGVRLIELGVAWEQFGVGRTPDAGRGGRPPKTEAARDSDRGGGKSRARAREIEGEGAGAGNRPCEAFTTGAGQLHGEGEGVEEKGGGGTLGGGGGPVSPLAAPLFKHLHRATVPAPPCPQLQLPVRTRSSCSPASVDWLPVHTYSSGPSASCSLLFLCFPLPLFLSCLSALLYSVTGSARFFTADSTMASPSSIISNYDLRTATLCCALTLW